MFIIATVGKSRWPIDRRAEPAGHPHLDGSYKGAIRSAPRTVLGSAVAAAVLISAIALIGASLRDPDAGCSRFPTPVATRRGPVDAG